MIGKSKEHLHGPQYSRAQRLVDLIDRLSRLARTGRQRSDLIPAQRETLSYLARANRFSRTPSAIARYLGATKGTVSQTVIALERHGYIIKQTNPSDARSVRLDLTEKGHEALFEAPIEPVARAIQSLPEERRGEVDRALAGLLSALVAEAHGRPFGVCKTCRHFEAEGSHTAGGHHRCRLLDVPLSTADSELICAEQLSP